MLDLQQKFTQRLNSLMEEKGLSQSNFAEAVGCSRQSVNNYLLGKRLPDIVVTAEMAQVLGVSCDYLVGLSDYREDRVTGITVRQLGLQRETVRFLGGLQLLARGSHLLDTDESLSAEERSLSRQVQMQQAAKTLDVFNKLVSHDAFGVLLQQIKQYNELSGEDDTYSFLQQLAVTATSPDTGKIYGASDPIVLAKEHLLRAICNEVEEIVKTMS